LGKPPLCKWSAVLQIRSFRTSKHTSAIRERQNGRSWSAAEQLPSNKKRAVPVQERPFRDTNHQYITIVATILPRD